jgi:hypothetical protein
MYAFTSFLLLLFIFILALLPCLQNYITSPHPSVSVFLNDHPYKHAAALIAAACSRLGLFELHCNLETNVGSMISMGSCSLSF